VRIDKQSGAWLTVPLSILHLLLAQFAAEGTLTDSIELRRAAALRGAVCGVPDFKMDALRPASLRGRGIRAGAAFYRMPFLQILEHQSGKFTM